MELLLWRWSTAVQVTSAVMIAVFFYVLGRSVKRVEVRPWVQAWLINLAALLVTVLFWAAQPQSQLLMIPLRFGYFFAKTMFVLLLLLGTVRFVHGRTMENWRIIVAAVGVGAAIGAVALDSVAKIGVTQSAIIAIGFSAAATLLVSHRHRGMGWLAAGFALRAVLAIAETAAYAISNPKFATFLASHSSFDTGAEWMIALGCVLTVHRIVQQELMDSNVALLTAKDQLQELVDRDSLTGLANRRALRGILRETYAQGATILFFDLNDFKEINDSYGHHAGDECLKSFARALQASFRPGDHVIRYAGDEFVVVAPGANPDVVVERIQLLRNRLKFDQGTRPQIRFSVGESFLPAHGDPDDAMKVADQAMYKDKARKTLKVRAPGK